MTYEQAGGPVYDIPKGRKDGTRSKIEDTFNLPAPSFNASDLIRMFGQHGFSVRDVVALSGNNMPKSTFVLKTLKRNDNFKILTNSQIIISTN